MKDNLRDGTIDRWVRNRAGSAAMRTVARAAAIALLALALPWSCAHAQHPQASTAHAVTGTCAGACEHYVSCKHQDNDNALYNACTSQCRYIFSDRGVQDHATLRDFERLDCPATVSFVEGSHGDEPTLRSPTGTESAEKK